LISYSLAGSQAYGRVLGFDYIYIIPIFIVVLAIFVVTMSKVREKSHLKNK